MEVIGNKERAAEFRPGDPQEIAMRRLGAAKTEAEERGRGLVSTFVAIQETRERLRGMGIDLSVKFDDHVLQAAWREHDLGLDVGEVPLMPLEGR
jgi:hypothetical protein